MPTYTYECPVHHEFEEFHSIRDDAKLTECPTCRKETDVSTPVVRLLSGGSGRGIVELTGRDLIDKTKADAKQFSKDVHASEKLYSNVLGEAKYQTLQQNIDRNKR